MNPLPIEQTHRELLPAVYEGYDPYAENNLRTHHDIALLFGVLAIATMLDPDADSRNGMAAQYHALSRAALVSGRVMEYPTCEAIQALVSCIVIDRSDANSMLDCSSSIYSFRFTSRC